METAKRAVRIAEAALTPRTRAVRFGGRNFRFVRSAWWDDTEHERFAMELEPYFLTFRGGDYRQIVDAGAAVGQFAVVVATQFASARVAAFEPSLRQRILLRRNARLNGVDARVDVIPCGLWDSEGERRFRTHGAIGSLEDAHQLPPGLVFGESVRTVTLDDWAHRVGVTRLDLVKMDIEGAELEAVRGMTNVLRTLRPELLIQAYHERDGARTFERVARLVEPHGYRCIEWGKTGLLHGLPEEIEPRINAD
jgi:FkbM family methyltransferase